MNDTCHPIILELQNPHFLPQLTAKTGDTGRSLRFILTDHGQPYHITGECSAMFTAKKPDGKILYHPCTIQENTVLYTFLPQTCAVAGELECELKLYGAPDKLLTSPRFILKVEEAIFNAGDVVEPV